MPRRNRGPHLRFIERRGAFYIVWYQLGAERMRSTGTADLGEAEEALLRYRADGVLPDMGFERDPAQYVYFIGGDMGAIKIGLTNNPQKRLQQLQCGSPIRLSIMALDGGGRKAENLYHSLLCRHRLHGEWFARHPDVLAEIYRLNREAA